MSGVRPGLQAPQGVRVAPQRVVDALAVGQAVARGVPPGGGCAV
jgi:hypothetical protein